MTRPKVIQVAEEKSLMALEQLFTTEGMLVENIRGPKGAMLMLRVPVAPYGIQIAVLAEITSQSELGARVRSPDRKQFWSELVRARRVAITLGKRRELDIRLGTESTPAL